MEIWHSMKGDLNFYTCEGWKDELSGDFTDKLPNITFTELCLYIFRLKTSCTIFIYLFFKIWRPLVAFIFMFLSFYEVK